MPVAAGDRLYFTTGGAIYRMSPDGSNLTEVLDPVSRLGREARASEGISVSEKGLVWGGRDGIYIAGVDGSHPGKLASAGEAQINPAPIGVAMNEAGLFWSVSDSPQLHLLNGSFPFAKGVSGQPLGLTAVGRDVIWSDPQQDAIFSTSVWEWWQDPIQVIDLDASFGAADYHPSGVAASESRLLWVDSAQDTVCVAGIDGRGPRVLIDLDSALGEADYSPLDIALSDSHLFWTDTGDDTRGIYTADLDGRSVRKLPNPLPTGVARWIAFLPGQAVDALPLEVQSDGDNLVFTWESRSGQRYTLRSTAESLGPRLEWPIYDGRDGIEATPPRNTLTIRRPADRTRFFVVEANEGP